MVYYRITDFSNHFLCRPLGWCVYRDDTSDKCDIPWYTTRKGLSSSVYTFPGLQKCNFDSFVIYTGIGQGRVTTNLKGAPIDDAVFVTDKEAVEMVRQSALYCCAKLLKCS